MMAFCGFYHHRALQHRPKTAGRHPHCQLPLSVSSGCLWDVKHWLHLPSIFLLSDSWGALFPSLLLSRNIPVLNCWRFQLVSPASSAKADPLHAAASRSAQASSDVGHVCSAGISATSLTAHCCFCSESLCVGIIYGGVQMPDGSFVSLKLGP